MQGYPRIELTDGFALERYFGWRLVEKGQGYRLLAKRLGPARKLLLLCEGVARDELDRLADRRGFFHPATMLTVQDFGWREGDPELVLGGRALRPVPTGNWFGAGTFVFDLSESEESLLGKIASRERSKLRKSERGGMRVELVERPSKADLDRFLELYEAMAQERSLEPIHRSTLERMFGDGALLMARAVEPNGRVVSVYVHYVTPTHGYYLYAVTDANAEDTAGHLLFWRSLQALKARGIRWYDFGLVASSDPSHGIFRFKKCFGGEFLPAGRQWDHNPAWMDRAVSVLRKARAKMNDLRRRRTQDLTGAADA